MHHSYSSSLSPFQAKTGMPPAATAAAAWSWVEKMLQELPAHRGAQLHQGLDQHRGLHRHVQTADDPGTHRGRVTSDASCVSASSVR